jgi:hypothetical protein
VAGRIIHRDDVADEQPHCGVSATTITPSAPSNERSIFFSGAMGAKS